MAEKSHTNYVLICGLLRDEIEFRITLSQVLEERDNGLFDEVILSTWHGEINSIAGLREELDTYGITTVESTPPKMKSSGNTWAQHKALLAGLRVIPDGAAVWRIRTDRSAHLLRPFRPCLEAGPSDCRSFGAITPIFKKRVAALAVITSIPYYAADFAFYGLKEDLMAMVTFDGVYDCMFRGFGAEHRLWTTAFLKAYPKLAEAYENLQIQGLSTHLVNAAKQEKPIPDFLLRLYAFYWITLYNNIEIMDTRGEYKSDMTLYGAFGGAQTSGIRHGSVASHFTVNICGLNQQAALDHLIAGELDDDSAIYQQFRDILADYKARGTDAMPVWSEEVREEIAPLQEDRKVELFLLPTVVKHPSGKGTPRTDENGVREDILSGARFRQLLMQESQAQSLSDETLQMITQDLKLTKNGFETGKLYCRIANVMLRAASDDQAQKQLGGFFLLRAAERGDVDAASQYAWLVYSGRLEGNTKDHAIRWAKTAALKENPLAQHTFALMHSTGWFEEADAAEGKVWQERALNNGFTPDMLNVD